MLWVQIMYVLHYLAPTLYFNYCQLNKFGVVHFTSQILNYILQLHSQQFSGLYKIKFK